MSAKWSDDTKFPVVSSLDYFVGLVGGANAKCSRTDLKSSLSLEKGDVGLGNVDNTSDAEKNASSATLVNKTISGSDNILTNIANASLTSSAITIAGTSVSLGDSIELDTIVGGTLGGAAFTDAAAYDAAGTADAAAAFAIQRDNHTGTQDASTVTALPVDIIVALSDLEAATTGKKFEMKVQRAFEIADGGFCVRVTGVPTGASLVIDIEKGSGGAPASVFSARPAVAASNEDTDGGGSVQGTLGTSPTTFAIGDIFSVHIDQIGSGDPGSGVVAVILATLT